MAKPTFRCPHCDQKLDEKFLVWAAGYSMNARRKTRKGKAKVMRACEGCGQEFSARDMRTHNSKCAALKAIRAQRKLAEQS